MAQLEVSAPALVLFNSSAIHCAAVHMPRAWPGINNLVKHHPIFSFYPKRRTQAETVTNEDCRRYHTTATGGREEKKKKESKTKPPNGAQQKADQKSKPFSLSLHRKRTIYKKTHPSGRPVGSSAHAITSSGVCSERQDKKKEISFFFSDNDDDAMLF